MESLPKVILERKRHKNRDIVCLKFRYSEELHRIAKQLNGRKWTNTYRCWYFEDKPRVYAELSEHFKGKALVNCSSDHKEETKVGEWIESSEPTSLAEDKQRAIENFIKQMRSERYSENTISTYSEALGIFFRYCGAKSMDEIGNADLIEFNNGYILENCLSASYQNQVINAVKLFFSLVSSRNFKPELLRRPRRERALPNILSMEEVKQILNAPVNHKHLVMLSLIYSCGLRCGELLRLKPQHIDSKRGLVIIKQSKGKKDRIVPLSEKILELLRTYWKMYKPRTYLFEGMKQGEMYDERSLQQVLKKAVLKAGIKKHVTLHWLRHSYATHLLENGVNLRYIQEILGHSSSKTTEIYTHVSNTAIQKITSPFDNL